MAKSDTKNTRNYITHTTCAHLLKRLDEGLICQRGTSAADLRKTLRELLNFQTDKQLLIRASLEGNTGLGWYQNFAMRKSELQLTIGLVIQPHELPSLTPPILGPLFMCTGQTYRTNGAVSIMGCADSDTWITHFIQLLSQPGVIIDLFKLGIVHNDMPDTAPLPAVSEKEAIQIVKTIQGHSTIGGIQDTLPSKSNIYNTQIYTQEPAWYVTGTWNDDFFGLHSSRLIIITRNTREILYDGGAGDEG